MHIYLPCFFILFAIGLLTNGGKEISKRKSHRKAKRFLAIAFFILSALCALRASSVGYDTPMYGRLFYAIGVRTDWLHLIASAPIYSLFNKIVYMIIPEYQAILIIGAIITNLSIAIFIYEFSEDVVMSTYLYILSYLYFLSFNTARQCAALSLMLFAILSLTKGKIIRSIFFALFSIGTHSTAISLLPILWLMRKPMTRSTLKRWTVAIIVSSMFIGEIMRYAIILFVRLFFQYAQYTIYIDGILEIKEYSTQGRNIYLSLLYMGILLIFFLFGKKHSHDYNESHTDLEQVNTLIVPCLISVAIGLAFSGNELFLRIREYFSFFFCCAIPSICNDSRINRNLLKTCILFVMFIPFGVQLSENSGLVLPYLFFWQK